MQMVMMVFRTSMEGEVLDDRLDSFRDRVQAFERELEVQQRMGVPFHIFVMPCIQWL